MYAVLQDAKEGLKNVKGRLAGDILQVSPVDGACYMGSWASGVCTRSSQSKGNTPACEEPQYLSMWLADCGVCMAPQDVGTEAGGAASAAPQPGSIHNPAAPDYADEKELAEDLDSSRAR
jgi:hypothetical protein